jgi:hypothetical protein
MLNTGSSQGSAKIYQFPAGGRATLAKAALTTAPRLNEAVSYDSWYHQAAIEESKVRDH